MAATLYGPATASGIERSQRLAGRTALVTGAARRVGAGIARALHGAGANVVIHCHRSLAAAGSLAAELEAARPDCAAVIACDLLDAATLPGLVAQARERFGALHLLIQCLDVLSDAARRHHAGRLGRFARHQPARTAVAGAGGSARAAPHAGRRAEYGRYPWPAAAA